MTTDVAWARKKHARLTDGGDDLRVEAGILLELGDALLLQPPDDAPVVVSPAAALVEPPGLKHLDVVDAGHPLRHLVTKVRVPVPADGSLGDRLHDGARILDGELLAVGGAFGPADAAGIHQVGLERPRAMQLEEPVGL